MSAPGPDPYAAPVAAATTPPAPARTHAPAAPTTVLHTPVHQAPGVRHKPRLAVTQRPAVAPRRLPTHPAPGLGARVAALVEPQQRVPRTLALAVALLVLLSAAFVAGAAREVAR